MKNKMNTFLKNDKEKIQLLIHLFTRFPIDSMVF